MKQLVRMMSLLAGICLVVSVYKFLTSQVLDSRFLLIALCLNGLSLGYHTREKLEKS